MNPNKNDPFKNSDLLDSDSDSDDTTNPVEGHHNRTEKRKDLFRKIKVELIVDNKAEMNNQNKNISIQEEQKQKLLPNEETLNETVIKNNNLSRIASKKHESNLHDPKKFSNFKLDVIQECSSSTVKGIKEEKTSKKKEQICFLICFEPLYPELPQLIKDLLREVTLCQEDWSYFWNTNTHLKQLYDFYGHNKKTIMSPKNFISVMPKKEDEKLNPTHYQVFRNIAAMYMVRLPMKSV